MLNQQCLVRIMVIAATCKTAYVGAWQSLDSSPFLPRRSHEIRHHRCHFLSAKILSSFLSNANSDFLPQSEEEEDTSFSTQSSTTELWLDLRGTQISPPAALLYLKEENLSSNGCVVDRILVSEDGIKRALQIRENDDPEVWFVSEKDKDIRSVTDRSILKGKTITIEGQFADPIPALEAVTKGAWVILDTDKSKIDESDRFGAISSLVDFVASGASSNSPLLLGGVGSLLSGELGGLGDATQVEETFCDDGSLGGVALTCESKDDVVKASSLLKSVLYGTGLITTDSGILLQKSECENDERNDTSGGHSKDNLQSAVLIPFDAQAWKTALFVFRDEDL